MATGFAPGLAEGLVLASLAACLLSFYWGMYRFFVVPDRGNARIGAVKWIGTGFGLASLAAIAGLGVASAAACALALLTGLASLLLFWWAIRTNRRQPLSFAFAGDLPRHLVREGPYRRIRHPFYAAYLLGWLVTPIATGELLTLIPFTVMSLAYTAAARGEERQFDATPLRAEYARYRREAGLFWPRCR